MMQQTFEQLRTIICGILSVDADQVTMERSEEHTSELQSPS